MERALVIVKPDGVRRNLIGKIMNHFTDRGVRIDYANLTMPSGQMIDAHYNKFIDRDFYPRIKDFMTSGKVFVMVLCGYNIIKNVRKMVGATDPAEADPNTIRGKFASCIEENVIHASENLEEFQRELPIWIK